MWTDRHGWQPYRPGCRADGSGNWGIGLFREQYQVCQLVIQALRARLPCGFSRVRNNLWTGGRDNIDRLSLRAVRLAPDVHDHRILRTDVAHSVDSVCSPAPSDALRGCSSGGPDFAREETLGYLEAE